MELKAITAAYGAKTFDPVVKGDKKAAPEKTAAAQKEQVELSDTSLSIQKLKEIIDMTPEIRIKVVEEIRTKIKYNGYPLESNLYKALEKIVENKIV